METTNKIKAKKKKCIRCNRMREVENFYLFNNGYYSSYCKKCYKGYKDYNKEYYQKNKDTLLPKLREKYNRTKRVENAKKKIMKLQAIIKENDN